MTKLPANAGFVVTKSENSVIMAARASTWYVLTSTGKRMIPGLGMAWEGLQGMLFSSTLSQRGTSRKVPSPEVVVSGLRVWYGAVKGARWASGAL
jgi:hypothetical protein